MLCIVGKFDCTSSPHLIEVRERIRINGRPLSRDAFSRYFWHCYHQLEDSKVLYSIITAVTYFSFG